MSSRTYAWFSPNRSLESVEFLRSFYDFPELFNEDIRSEVETYIPVICHLLQTSLPAKQRAYGNT